jgi:hypothetical protein
MFARCRVHRPVAGPAVGTDLRRMQCVALLIMEHYVYDIQASHAIELAATLWPTGIDVIVCRASATSYGGARQMAPH